MKRIIIGILCFLIGGGGAFFGVQYFMKTGLFKPGELLFADDISEKEKADLLEALAKTKLSKNVTVSQYYTDKLEDGFLADIFLPVANFYEPEESISSEEFNERFIANKDIVSVQNLNQTMKLLAVGGNYYLDSLESGAKFKYFKVEGENEEDVEKVSNAVLGLIPKLPTRDDLLSFTQTGVTALSRNMNTKMNEVGSGEYFAENIASYLKKFDLTHTSNESSFSDWASSANICSDWRFVDTLTSIGLDIVELTGNHNVDCGDDDAISTYEKYLELGIKPVGGGRGESEAEKPLEINEKGTKITMLAYNQSTGGATWDETPGANQYYEENAEERISEAKERGDFVIVDVQFNECNAYASTEEDTTCDGADSAPGGQVALFRSLIDMGADIVVGTSAHQTQTFERYGDGEIYYGLGNLFFDQIWWPGTTRSLGLTHYFWNGKLLQTRRFGTIYDSSYQTRVMNEDEIEWFVDRLNQAR